MPTIKTTLKGFLKRLGLEVKRIDPSPTPPLVVADPLEAIFLNHAGEITAIQCPLDDCVIYNGFSFGERSWHPFVAAAKEKLMTPSQKYHGSILEHFYQTWCPTNAFDALIGLTNGPDFLKSYPAHTMHFPWLEPCPEARRRVIEKIILSENKLHGGKKITISEGYGLQGPVSIAKGELEYGRLTSILASISKKGIDRSFGDPTAQVLKRGDEYRFRISHGHHRIAAAAALGYKNVPIIPVLLVDYEEADHWPQVHRGRWSKKDALEYFDHHFIFDSYYWAKERDLTK